MINKKLKDSIARSEDIHSSTHLPGTGTRKELDVYYATFFLPVDRAMPTPGVLPTMPKELLNDAVDLLEHQGADGDGNHDVGRDRTKHVMDQAEAFATGEESRTPSGEFLRQPFNDGQQR